MKKRGFLLLMLVTAMFLFGCSGKKYQVDYDGSKDLFGGAKDSYAAGTKVRLTFGLIASDTDYRFHVEGADFKVDWENEDYVITFTMPERDVKVTFSTVNSMMNTLPEIPLEE